jgi:hypothetical protein
MRKLPGAAMDTYIIYTREYETVQEAHAPPPPTYGSMRYLKPVRCRYKMERFAEQSFKFRWNLTSAMRELFCV